MTSPIPGPDCDWCNASGDDGSLDINTFGEEFICDDCLERLCNHTPDLLEALMVAIGALNTAPCFKVGETDSYAIASQCELAIRKATGKHE